MHYRSDWLPQLKGSIPVEAQRNNISMYSIALEGWRRGMNVSFYKDTRAGKIDIKYALKYKGKEHHFYGSCGDLNTLDSIEICDNKFLTKKYLLRAGLPVPEGNLFEKKSSEANIKKYAETIGYPVVLKPIDTSGGKGVYVNLKNEKDLLSALERNKYDNLLLEQYIPGEEVRVFVLDNRVIGAVNRKPANVVGDGKNTIYKLIELKNEERKKVPHLKFRPIKVDREVIKMLKSAGYTPDSIPEAGQMVVLRKTSNVSMGGDPIEITEVLDKKVKDIAVAAMKAIPGLNHCGVDLIINKKNNTVVVLEVNARPGIGSHLFPYEGTAKNIPEQLISYYFPETKNKTTENANVYFDFGIIKDKLLNGSAEVLELDPPQHINLYAKKYSYESDINPIKYFDWLRKKVYERKLNGFIRNTSDNEIELILAGDSKNEVEEFIKLFQQKISKYNIKNLKEHSWNLPVKYGFELLDGLNSISTNELEMSVKDEQKNINKLIKEKSRYKNQIKKIENSRFWKVTSLIRKFVK